MRKYSNGNSISIKIWILLNLNADLEERQPIVFCMFIQQGRSAIEISNISAHLALRIYKLYSETKVEHSFILFCRSIDGVDFHNLDSIQHNILGQHCEKLRE